VDLLEIFREPLLDLVVTILSETRVGGSSEFRCRVQTLFGNDVWWNEK
jgi:hypothetical protein